MNHVKTPVQLITAGLIIVLMVCILVPACSTFGLDLNPDNCNDEATRPGVVPSVIFNIGLTGVFMIFLGTVWIIKVYFILN